MRAGAASPPPASRLRPASTVTLPGESLLRHWPRVPAGNPSAVIRALMSCYGVPLLETRLRRALSKPRRSARDLGFPVAMKATRPGLVHKSEAGGVQPRTVRRVGRA